MNKSSPQNTTTGPATKATNATNATNVLATNDDFPVRVAAPVHSGKVRAVYWLTSHDARRLITSRNYPVAEDTQLGLMVISDRISAFECQWRAEGGLDGVPQKGAALNAISAKWFHDFKTAGLAHSHIVDIPHPLVWVVQRAQPVMLEGVVRQYITGSMWRGYAGGDRTICGIPLPEGLSRDQRLPQTLLTPSTKGIIRGVPGVPEQDDVNVSRQHIAANLSAFGLRSQAHLERLEQLQREGFALIEKALAKQNQIFVDTKFEFGYGRLPDGSTDLIYIDEVGTPDSSRIWDGAAYNADGTVVERSKEAFRQLLLQSVPNPELLTDKNRMAERTAMAEGFLLPQAAMQQVSKVYVGIAEDILGHPLPRVDQPRQQINDALSDLGVIR